jgi:hypothetical protein
MSDLGGLPTGYTKKTLVVRFNNDSTGASIGKCHLYLNEPIYNVVYVDWVSVANSSDYYTPSALIGKFLTVKQFKNDGQFTQSSSAGGGDYRFWAYINSQSNETTKAFADDMFNPPINLHELDIQVRGVVEGDIDITYTVLVLEVWCKTSR